MLQEPSGSDQVVREKSPSGKLDKFHVDILRKYYSNVEDQQDLDEALGWFTEHLVDDNSVALKYTLPSGQTLTSRNFDLKETRYVSATARGSST